MTNPNVGPASGPSGTPKRRKHKQSLTKAIAAVPTPAPDPAPEKKPAKKSRIRKDHPEAYVTRSDLRNYRGKYAKKTHGYVISVFQRNDEWYLRLTSSLTKFLKCRHVEAFRRAHPGDVHTFLAVAYKGHEYLNDPPLANNVHDTSFVKFDKYMELLVKTGDKGVDFARFLKEVFESLQGPERDFVKPYYTGGGVTMPLQFIVEDEETPKEAVSPDPPKVLATETISNGLTASTSTKARIAARLRRIQEQKPNSETDERIRLLERVKFLEAQVDNLTPYKDGLAKAHRLSKGDEAERKEKSQLLEALMETAAEDEATSGG